MNSQVMDNSSPSTFLEGFWEVASSAWMEVLMFVMAAVVYLVCLGGRPVAAAAMRFFTGLASTKADDLLVGGAGLSKDPDAVTAALRSKLECGDHGAAVRLWKLAISSGGRAFPTDLVAGSFEAMRKSGMAPAVIVEQLAKALDCNPSLLDSVAALPDALLRDDAVDLLEALLALLDEHGYTVDAAIYSGLMCAHLRRKNFEAVGAVAARVPHNFKTSRMRATLAAAAAHRNRLDEALGHLRQIAAPVDADKGCLPRGAAVRILALAAKDSRVSAVSTELQRLHARLETRQLDELLAACSRRRDADPKICRELLEVGDMLKVPKGSGAYEALACIHAKAASRGDESGLVSLIEELESVSSKDKDSAVIKEPLAVAMLNACKAAQSEALTLRVFRLHTKSCAGAPGPLALGAVCGALADCGSPEAACDFFELEMATKNVWPDAVVTGLLAKAAAQVGRNDLAKRLFDHASVVESVKQDPQQRDIRGYGSNDMIRQMKAHARQRDIKQVKAIFKQGRATNSEPSSMLYNCFLDACVQCGDLDCALAHFDEMKRLRVLDIVGYNTLLKGYLSKELWDEARKLLLEMTAAGLQANKVTFNELLNAKVSSGDASGMWRLVQEMRDAGVLANSVTCSILLKSLSTHSTAEDVSRIMCVVDDMGEQMDEVLFSSIIEACLRVRQLKLLSDIMRRYRERGIRVTLTSPTYGSMIKAYGQVGDVDSVRQVWVEMDEQGVRPTSITIGCMVESLVTNNLADEAWALISKELACEEKKGNINTVIFSTVIKGFALTRRIEKVFKVYQEMRTRNVVCNTITYNTMLDACAKSCTMSRAGGLLVDMRASNVEPDIITYSTIVKGYCAEGDLERAFRVLDEMKTDDRLVPDEIMYNSLLDGCAKQQRVDDALRVLEEMQVAEIGPSNYTLSILVKLLGRSRRLGQAFQMVEDLSKKHKFRPNVHVYTCLMQACILNRRLERALALHDTIIIDKACKFDEKLYGVLTKGCLKTQALLRSVDVVRFAYQLPGMRALSTQTQEGERVASVRGPVIGLDHRSLEEVLAALRTGSKDEQAAAEQLSRDLKEHRGVQVSASFSSTRNQELRWPPAQSHGRGGGNNDASNRRGR